MQLSNRSHGNNTTEIKDHKYKLYREDMTNKTCDMHQNEKKKKFCRETSCWERLCPLCVQERHNGHNVVDFSTILAEVKAEKDKNTMSKGRALTELKKALGYLDRIQKNVKDERTKVKDRERKLRIQVESQMKALGEAISLQQEKAQRTLDGAVEELSAKKSELARVMTAIDKLVEQIMINGDGYNIHKFFDLCNTDYSTGMEEMIDEVEREYGHLQDLERRIASCDLGSLLRTDSPRPSPTPRFGKTEGRNRPGALQTAEHLRSPNIDNGVSKLVKLAHFGTLRRVSPQKTEVESRLESLKKSLQQVTLQVKEKKAILQDLETKISAKNKDIDILESKRDKLLKANSSLKEHLETQNRVFENSTKALCVSPTYRSYISSVSPLALTRPSMTPSANSMKMKAHPLNLNLVQNNVNTLLIL
eukprot:TRINITY_DN10728_c0_g11_i1.p2 TRINITY_DN10728_c0_g11~~TRINITY_DN10728_c0_g11_i1.p2  ORF type:complete len:420 (-),score=107.51 TRINITY_DN10728_c0_g11_i1:2254-3513(-)